MEKYKTTIYVIIVFCGILTAALSLMEQGGDDLNIVVRDGHTFVDGVMAPHLSDLPFHGAYIDDGTCLSCHANGKEIDLMGTAYVAQKMAHEKRDNCDRCHHPANH